MRSARLFVAVLIGCCLGQGGADGAEWQSLLDRPVSPVTVALLPHANEPAVQKRWTQALRDPRSGVRAAAARVANVAATTSLVPVLFTGLGEETDPWAALEGVRSAFSLLEELNLPRASTSRRHHFSTG